MAGIAGIIVDGLLLGSLYALFGLGLAFAFGVMRIVNIAHGEFIVLSAYVGLTLGHVLQLNPVVLVIVVAAIAFVLGYGLQAGLLNRLMGRDPLPILLVTFGLSIILRNLMVESFGADPRTLEVGALKFAGVDILGARVGVLPLIIAFLSGAIFVALEALLKMTRFGRVLRATSDDAATVRLFGVDSRTVFNIAMGVAVALSAFAGSLLSMRTAFTPFSGVDRLLISFEVVIVGGLGSLWGALAGGLLLGVVQMAGLRIAPGSGLLPVHIAFFVVLMLLPGGIAGWRRAGGLPSVAGSAALTSFVTSAARSVRDRSLVMIATIVVLMLAIAPVFLEAGDLRLMIEILTALAMAQMWNLLAGYTGRISMGHQAFVGIGAYATFVFSNMTGASPYGSLLVAPVVCAAVALVIAPVPVPPARRLLCDRHVGLRRGLRHWRRARSVARTSVWAEPRGAAERSTRPGSPRSYTGSPPRLRLAVRRLCTGCCGRELVWRSSRFGTMSRQQPRRASTFGGLNWPSSSSLRRSWGRPGLCSLSRRSTWSRNPRSTSAGPPRCSSSA